MDVVYFVRETDRGAVKIGTSNNFQRRFWGLDSTSVPLEILGTIPGDRITEKDWHTRFSHLWLRGEWFRGEGDLLAAIEAAVQGEVKQIPTRKKKSPGRKAKPLPKGARALMTVADVLRESRMDADSIRKAVAAGDLVFTIPDIGSSFLPREDFTRWMESTPSHL